MKIAIPLEEDRHGVCGSFARAPYFLFGQPDQETVEILDNPAAQAEGGAGLQAAQFLVDQQAEALITVRCGQNAAEVLQAAGIAIYEACGGPAEEQLKHFHAGFVGIL